MKLVLWSAKIQISLSPNEEEPEVVAEFARIPATSATGFPARGSDFQAFNFDFTSNLRFDFILLTYTFFGPSECLANGLGANG
jgi:hypothetical protein